MTRMLQNMLQNKDAILICYFLFYSIFSCLTVSTVKIFKFPTIQITTFLTGKGNCFLSK